MIYSIKEKYVCLRPEDRIYRSTIPVIGITGGIASGKTTVINILREKKLPIICGDNLVKKIYAEDDTLGFVQNNYPHVMSGGKINFPALREEFFSREESKVAIENFIWKKLPRFFHQELETILDSRPDSDPDADPPLPLNPFVIYEYPILFEQNMASYFDVTVCVYIDQETQIERLINRDGITIEWVKKILDKQLGPEKKRDLAQFVLYNQGTVEELRERVDSLVEELLVKST